MMLTISKITSDIFLYMMIFQFILIEFLLVCLPIYGDQTINLISISKA